MLYLPIVTPPTPPSILFSICRHNPFFFLSPTRFPPAGWPRRTSSAAPRSTPERQLTLSFISIMRREADKRRFTTEGDEMNLSAKHVVPKRIKRLYHGKWLQELLQRHRGSPIYTERQRFVAQALRQTKEGNKSDERQQQQKAAASPETLVSVNCRGATCPPPVARDEKFPAACVCRHRVTLSRGKETWRSDE